MYTIVVNHCFLVQDLNFFFIVNVSCLQAQQLSNNEEQNGTISYDASVEIEVDSTYNADQQIGNESTLTFLLTLGYCACAVRVTVVVLCVCVCVCVCACNILREMPDVNIKVEVSTQCKL